MKERSAIERFKAANCGRKVGWSILKLFHARQLREAIDRSRDNNSLFAIARFQIVKDAGLHSGKLIRIDLKAIRMPKTGILISIVKVFEDKHFILIGNCRIHPAIVVTCKESLRFEEQHESSAIIIMSSNTADKELRGYSEFHRIVRKSDATFSGY